MKRNLILLFIIFNFQLTTSQKIAVNIVKFDEAKKELVIEVTNNSDKEIWFYVPGFNKQHLTDKHGNEIIPIRRIESGPRSEKYPTFVLLDKFNSKFVKIPLSKFLSQFDLDKHQTYFLHMKYVNLSMKKDNSNLDTFIGEVVIKNTPLRCGPNGIKE